MIILERLSILYARIHESVSVRLLLTRRHTSLVFDSYSAPPLFILLVIRDTDEEFLINAARREIIQILNAYSLSTKKNFLLVFMLPWITQIKIYLIFIFFYFTYNYSFFVLLLRSICI